MEPAGRNPNQILNNSIQDSFSWNIFQAISWLDYAKREQSPSAIHYAAFELRYGIEYLLFELLVLANESLSEVEYKKCIGDPKEMKKLLRTLGPTYSKLSEFSEVLMKIDPKTPEFRFWDINQLFRYWGTASRYLHFFGAQTLTYEDDSWVIKSIAEIERILQKLRKDLTETIGTAIMRPSGMAPEVHQAWVEFSTGALSIEDVRIRMNIALPILGKRLRNPL